MSHHTSTASVNDMSPCEMFGNENDQQLNSLKNDLPLKGLSQSDHPNYSASWSELNLEPNYQLSFSITQLHLGYLDVAYEFIKNVLYQVSHSIRPTAIHSQTPYISCILPILFSLVMMNFLVHSMTIPLLLGKAE